MKDVKLTRTQAKTVMNQMETAAAGYKGKDLRRLGRIYIILEPYEEKYMEKAKDVDPDDQEAVKEFLDGYGSEEIDVQFESTDYDLIVKTFKAMDSIRGNRGVVRELVHIREAFKIEDED